MAGIFVAVGHNGLRLRSTDGKSWEHVAEGKEGQIFRAVNWGNGRFVAVGSFGGNNTMAASEDGITWTEAKSDSKYSRYFRGLVFGAGKFIALGGDPVTVGVAKPFVSTTKDGVDWSAFQDIPGKFILRRAAFGDGRFVGVGDRGRRAWSKDGLAWMDVEGVKAKDTCTDVAYGGGIFVGVGLHGLRTSTPDGTKWSEPVRSKEGEHLNSIHWAGDRFVAVGAGVTFESSNGADWTQRANENAPPTVAYGNRCFVGSDWRGRLMRSEDGLRWEETFRAPHHIEALCCSD